ncbi:MAG: multiheme c-type cytochrome [Verrucomicrobiota bacterium]
MNVTIVQPARRRGAVFPGAILIFTLGTLLQSAASSHVTVPVEGGYPGLPVMTGMTVASNGLAITWEGPSGYYTLYRKGSLSGGAWQAATNRLLGGAVTVPATSSNGFFKVAGPSPNYGGSANCASCHGTTVSSESKTPHAGALATLTRIGQGSNPACLPCHTVGYGLPTGFVNATATPRLAGVQCENCHGPAGNHMNNESDPTIRPAVDISAAVCGGCHDGSPNPIYSEWQSSAHSVVVEDMNPTNRLVACGQCHSGTTRLSLLNHQTPVPGDANMPVVCVVCHDPHAVHVWTNILTGEIETNQLRNPVASTNDYSLATTAVFTNVYNPSINICGQCHNRRGAAWTDTSRAPHPSAQYNMLVGTLGVVLSGGQPSRPAAHALLIGDQCVGCHMQVPAPPQTVAGHAFEVQSYDACILCHPLPDMLVQFTTNSVLSQVYQLRDALNVWAAQKAPAELWTNYGVLSWEYTTPGGLSVGTKGPSTAQQSLISTNILKARFNLYEVYNEGSLGVHNGPLTTTLLNDALTWVQVELNN